MSCNICGLPATVHELDNDGWYCDFHADERLICATNHEHLHPLQEETP
jgi:hypothetical protein